MEQQSSDGEREVISRYDTIVHTLSLEKIKYRRIFIQSTISCGITPYSLLLVQWDHMIRSCHLVRFEIPKDKNEILCSIRQTKRCHNLVTETCETRPTFFPAGTHNGESN